MFLRRVSWLTAALLVLCYGPPAQGQFVVQWDFEGDLVSADGMFELNPEVAPPLDPFVDVPDFSFEEAEIGGETADVLAWEYGTYFRAFYAFEANGGGTYVNQYTLIVDVMYEDRSVAAGSWACLYNTNDGAPPANDADWCINAAGGLGISGNYGGFVADGEWHRLALVVDLVQGTYTSYINGEQVQQNTGLDLDGRFSLYTDRLLLYADDNGEAAPGLVNSIQLRDIALSGSQIAAIGGPTADGIPSPDDLDVRDCFFREFLATYDPDTNEVSCSWLSLPGDEGFRVFRDGTQLGADLAANVTSFVDSAPPAGGAAVTYTLQSLVAGGVDENECTVTIQTFVCPSNVVCCPDQANERVELSWTPGVNLDFTGYTVTRDGAVVANVDAGDSSYTDDVPGPGRYDYQVSVASGNPEQCPAPLGCVTSVTGIVIRAPGGCGGIVNQWDFNGNLTSSTGGRDLEPELSPPLDAALDVPDFTFETMEINGEEADVARYGRGTIFKLHSGLPPNGGGAYTNQYTLIMDVMFPEGSLAETGWAALYNTNATNSNDGDWFVRGSDGSIGVAGNYGGLIEEEVWYRVALVVDLVAGTYTSYIDGLQVQQNTGEALDGRYSLYSVADGPDLEGFHIFADDTGENATGFVNSVQVRDVAMSAGELAAMGGPAADGIPFTTPHVCPAELSCCVDQSAGTVTLSWSGGEGLPVVAVRRDGEEIALVEGASSHTDDGVSEGSHDYEVAIAAGDLQCANFPLSCRVTVVGGDAIFFDDFNCYHDDAELEAAGWQRLDVGDPIEASTWTITNPLGRGNPPDVSGKPTGGRFVISDSDFGGTGDIQNVAGSGMSHDLVSPSFSTAGIDTVWLHLDVVAQLNNNGDAVFDVDVSVDDGGTWENVFRRIAPARAAEPFPEFDANADGFFGRLDVDLSALAANRPGVRVRLRHFEPTWDWFIAVDNFRVDSNPVAGGNVTVLDQEDFGDGIPEEWTVESGIDSEGLTIWNSDDSCSLSLLAQGGVFPDTADGRQLHHFDGFFALTDPICFFSRQDEFLITPAIDCSQLTKVYLHARSSVLATDLAHAEILVSLDGGTTFEEEPLFSYNGGGLFDPEEEPFFNEFVLEEPRAAGQAEVAFAFHYRSATPPESPDVGTWWAVDDVKVTGAGDTVEPSFIRGDSNADGSRNITDGVFIFSFLFTGGQEPPCKDAADTSDQGSVNITSGIYILNFLFLGGPPPPAPFPACGPDGTADEGGQDLGCASFAPCP